MATSAFPKINNKNQNEQQTAQYSTAQLSKAPVQGPAARTKHVPARRLRPHARRDQHQRKHKAREQQHRADVLAQRDDQVPEGQAAPAAEVDDAATPQRDRKPEGPEAPKHRAVEDVLPVDLDHTRDAQHHTPHHEAQRDHVPRHRPGVQEHQHHQARREPQADQPQRARRSGVLPGHIGW